MLTLTVRLDLATEECFGAEYVSLHRGVNVSPPCSQHHTPLQVRKPQQRQGGLRAQGEGSLR